LNVKLQRHTAESELYIAASGNQVDIVQYLLQNGAMGIIPKTYCIKHHANSRLAQLFVNYGIDVNDRNSEGQSPLYWSKNKEMTCLPLKYGVDINLLALFGNNPFHNACRSGSIQLVLFYAKYPQLA
jgi:ankyrin repeat protein